MQFNFIGSYWPISPPNSNFNILVYNKKYLNHPINLFLVLVGYANYNTFIFQVTNIVNSNQPGVLCEHCGKRYGSTSISIHREQCIKKSKRRDSANNENRKQDNKENSATRKTSAPLTVICNICGRNFGSKSIAFHEPQCLKKWKMENEKVPQSPPKSNFKSNVHLSGYGSGNEAQDEMFWKAHQAQLVPCGRCQRTFYPDRLEIHLRGCKGDSKKKKFLT